MERNILGLLLIHLLAHLFVGNASQTISRFVYNPSPKSWPEAQNFCREHHTDLVTIRNEEQAELLSTYKAWIGLYRAPDEKWKWSTGEELSNLDLWKSDHVQRSPPGPPGPSGPPGPNPPGPPHRDEHCAMWSNSGWESEECDEKHPFLCTNEKWILVQQLKTWEEALLHCRQLQTRRGPHRSDLASLSDTSKSLLDKETIRQHARTDEVWVGLRFLAGKWLWMDKEAVTSSQLPRCPAEEEHCGALAHHNMDVQILKCTERKNFLCSTTA